MAFTHGADGNYGFTADSPVGEGDPGGSSQTADGYFIGQYDTSPNGNYHVTELGWRQNVGTNGAANYQMALYSFDVGDGNRPSGSPIGAQTGNATIANTAEWYAYTGLNIDLFSATTFWIIVGIQNVANANLTRYSNVGALKCLTYSSAEAPTLPDPWGAGTGTVTDNVAMAVYAVYEADAGGVVVPGSTFKGMALGMNLGIQRHA